MSAPRVLIGRRADADPELVSLLEAAGFVPTSVPLIQITAPADPDPLRRAVTRLAAGGFDWVALTSVPAVEAVLATSTGVGAATPIPPGTAVAAVGAGTAAALDRAGIRVDLLPEAGGSAAELLDAWPPGQGSVLLPRSEIATDELPNGLRDKGYDVSTVTAYQTGNCPVPPAVLAELATGGFAAVVLGSGSAARSLARFPVADRTAVVAIGPSTAQAATVAGLRVAAVAAHPTAAGLAAAVQLALDRPALVHPPLGACGHGSSAARTPHPSTHPGPGSSAPAASGPMS